MKANGKILLVAAFLLVVLLLEAFTVQAAPFVYPSYQPISTQMAELINKEMAATGTVGLSIAVVDDQRVVWAEGFGWADKANKVPATAETIYQVASITKMFTVYAAMRLAQDNRLDLDAPIQAYLPSFSIQTRYPNGGPITARTLMTHHSGIPSDYFGIDMAKPFSQVTDALKNQYTCFPPNHVYSYSNPGIIVLGDIVASVSGIPYHQYVRETLIDPLGMRSSFFEIESDRMGDFAHSYDNGRVQTPLPTIGVLPAAGLYSSALDLAQFAKMIFSAGVAGEVQVLNKTSLDETLRAQNENIPLDGTLRIGLGWTLSESAIRYAGRVAKHEGHFNSYATNITLLPDQKLAVIVLANSTEADRLVGSIADKTLAALLAEKRAIAQPVAKEKPLLPKVTLSKQTAEELTGYYSTDLGVIQVSASDNKLVAKTPDFKFDLIPRENGLFTIQYTLLGLFPINLGDLSSTYISFPTISGRKAVQMDTRRGSYIIGEKAPPPFLPDPWKDMAGAYELNGIKTTFSLIPQRIVCRVENERIIFEMANPLKDYPSIKTWGFIIQPLSTNDGIVVGLGRWKGDTVRRELVNGVQHIYFAGLDYQKLGTR